MWKIHAFYKDKFFTSIRAQASPRLGIFVYSTFCVFEFLCIRIFVYSNFCVFEFLCIVNFCVLCSHSTLLCLIVGGWNEQGVDILSRFS